MRVFFFKRTIFAAIKGVPCHSHDITRDLCWAWGGWAEMTGTRQVHPEDQHRQYPRPWHRPLVTWEDGPYVGRWSQLPPTIRGAIDQVWLQVAAQNVCLAWNLGRDLRTQRHISSYIYHGIPWSVVNWMDMSHTLVANAHATVFNPAELQILFIARQQLDPTVVYRATSLGIRGTGLGLGRQSWHVPSNKGMGEDLWYAYDTLEGMIGDEQLPAIEVHHGSPWFAASRSWLFQ